jgi:hypothetical protein
MRDLFSRMLLLWIGRTLLARIRERLDTLEKTKRRSTGQAGSTSLKLRTIASEPTQTMIRALRETKYFSDLVERDGKIYSTRSEQPFCSRATIDALVDRGWLRRRQSRYKITNAGKQVERDLAP